MGIDKPPSLAEMGGIPSPRCWPRAQTDTLGARRPEPSLSPCAQISEYIAFYNQGKEYLEAGWGIVAVICHPRLFCHLHSGCEAQYCCFWVAKYFSGINPVNKYFRGLLHEQPISVLFFNIIFDAFSENMILFIFLDLEPCFF